MSDFEYIREQIPAGEQLAMLAEEAMELGQAALKLRRALDGTNPTPVGIDGAMCSFREELSDVLLCLRVLGYGEPTGAMEDIIQAKTQRWVSRLREKKR